MVQSWPARRSVLPTSNPANWRSAPSPTSSSRMPGLNLRPFTILTFCQTVHASSPTPRIATLASVVGSLFFGTFATTTSSADAIGLPCASLAMPGACSITSISSRVSTELLSAPEPPRNTMAVSLLPVCCKVAVRPSPIASNATSTPTTPAMPTTITAVEPRRSVSVLKPTRVTDKVRRPVRASSSHSTSRITSASTTNHGNAVHTTSHATTIAARPRPNRNFFMSRSSTASQCIDDLQAHAAQGGQHADHNADHDHQHDALDPTDRADRWQLDHPAAALGECRRQHAGDRHADHAADQQQHDRFGQHQRQDTAVGKPDR